MTTFEHAMLGITLTMVTGVQKSQGWGVVVMAAPAAAMADWDGLSILFGGEAYSKVHRVWGHNILVAGTSGAMVGLLGYLVYLSAGVRRYAIRLIPEANPASTVEFSQKNLVCWVLVGMLAALCHLPADMIFSGHKEMTPWPIQPYWPFHEQGYVWPLVSWGDLTATVLFIATMFAVYRWPQRARGIALLCLIALHGYIGFCWFQGGINR